MMRGHISFPRAVLRCSWSAASIDTSPPIECPHSTIHVRPCSCSYAVTSVASQAIRLSTAASSEPRVSYVGYTRDAIAAWGCVCNRRCASRSGNCSNVDSALPLNLCQLSSILPVHKHYQKRARVRHRCTEQPPPLSTLRPRPSADRPGSRRVQLPFRLCCDPSSNVECRRPWGSSASRQWHEQHPPSGRIGQTHNPDHEGC